MAVDCILVVDYMSDYRQVVLKRFVRNANLIFVLLGTLMALNADCLGNCLELVGRQNVAAERYKLQALEL